jgi:competence protein ComEC
VTVAGALGRHPHLVLLGAFLAGLLSAGIGQRPLPAEPVVLAAAAAVAALAWLRAPALGVWVLVALAAGAATGAARVGEIDAPGAVIDEGLAVEGPVVLLERPRASAFGSSAVVELTSGPAEGARLVARASDEVEWPAEAGVGDELSVNGFAAPAEHDPDAEFDWPAHLSRTGVAGELELRSVEATGGARGGPAGAIDSLRKRAEKALEEGASEPQAALIRGMVLGQDERIDDLVRDDFRASGLAHILAVSGQNVLFLSLLALPLLASLGVGPRARLVVVLGLIALYVPLAGAGPSLQRAGAVGAASLVALALGRPASRWYALTLAAVATLALNPRSCGDPGWQLSFAAVVGILAMGPSLRRAFSGLPRPLAEGLSLTVAATLATAPLLMHHFDQVSLASLPANVLALPAVAPAMWIGMVQMSLGQAVVAGEPSGTIALWLSGLLGAVNGVLLDYIAELARRFAELPWAEAEVALRSPWEVAAAFAVLALAVAGARRAGRRVGPAVTELGGRWRTSPPRARLVAVLALTAASLALGAKATDPGAPPDRLTVSFLDVGQGDATLIQHPAGGSILIDGGPVEARVYRLVRAAGVDRLGLVVATHAAADHHGGLREVLQNIPVEVLLDGGDGTTDPDFRALLEEAARQGVRRVPAVTGQELAVGHLRVDVLWPEPREGPPPEDPNLRAVTTLVSAGDFELLASGDAESPSLAALDLPDVDVLKVPHHGSEDEGLPPILAELRPEVAGIGVGEDNGYGHPTPSTLAALEQAGADVYRTDLDGTTEVTVADGGLAVSTER